MHAGACSRREPRTPARAHRKELERQARRAAVPVLKVELFEKLLDSFARPRPARVHLDHQEGAGRAQHVRLPRLRWGKREDRGHVYVCILVQSWLQGSVVHTDARAYRRTSTQLETRWRSPACCACGAQVGTVLFE